MFDTCHVVQKDMLPRFQYASPNARRCLERSEDLLLPHLAVFARLSLARFALRHGSLERPRPAAARRGGGGKGTGKVIAREESRDRSAAASMEVQP